MSTAYVEQVSFGHNPPSRAIVQRFVWKEYRVLRGLWLAVAGMALLVDWAVGVLAPPQSDFAVVYFNVALAAAVLYAVGAAATTFSLEHEEETYGFLSGLPALWWPVFVGKLAVAAVSAAALAGVLAIVGCVIGGGGIPSWRDASLALGLFGVAIVEAIAWGTLFSLLTRRPLTAAILTLVVGTTIIHLVVQYWSTNISASLLPHAYRDGMPWRLAIVAAVLAASAAVARRWLVLVAQPAAGSASLAALWPAMTRRASERIGAWTLAANRGSRRRMMARLLWQTWRDAWKRLPIPIVVAVVMFLATGVFGYLIAKSEIATLGSAATLFFAPALYGALAFSSDQRRGSYRFLAEHAARPRYVWLARHIVWLGAVVLLSAVLAGLIVGGIAVALRMSTANAIDHYFQYGYWGYPSIQQMQFELERGIRGGLQVTGLASCGILAAYAVGQLCSMLVRSEIMAAFVAMVLSVLLAAWIAVLFVWDLAGWVFLLPLFVGLMLATWSWVPAWIAEQRSWRKWLWPALAVGTPLVVIGALLPVVRLGQLPIRLRGQPIDAQSAIANQLDWYRQGDSPEARETATMYLKAADLLESWQYNDLLERWNKPEYMEAIGGETYEAGNVGSYGIDVTKIPADERAAYWKAVDALAELEAKATEAAIKLAISASQRQSCRFDFDISEAQTKRGDSTRDLQLGSIRDYERVDRLLSHVLQQRTNSDQSLQPKLAALRMSAHIRSGQPSAVFVDQMRREQQILAEIGRWAFDDERTKEQLRAAMEQLRQHFGTAYINTDENLIADHLIINDVLTGKLYPLSLSEGQYSDAAYLAFLANQLRWERDRGLRALNLITLQNIVNASELIKHLSHQRPRELGYWQLRRWLQPLPSGFDSFPSWIHEQPAAATSYLPRFEYQARVQAYDILRAICDTEVHRRAALIKVALARYHLKYDKYPKSLAELAPEYIDREPLDPYDGQPFQFLPEGLDLPLRRIGYSVTDVGDIEPGTPFFWSVGGGNARLQRQMTTRIDGLGNIPEEERRPVEETVYQFRGDDASAWYYPPLIFPLP